MATANRRPELLGEMYGPELIEAFREFKAIWDPAGLMNPGKVVDPYPITSNLRLGPDYRPPQVETRFSFPTEGGWDRAAIRCVGVGECRRHHLKNGIMCPSYMATREEKHSTRARLEPACVAAFRDEVCALFPDDERARRLKDQSFLFSESTGRTPRGARRSSKCIVTSMRCSSPKPRQRC